MKVPTRFVPGCKGRGRERDAVDRFTSLWLRLELGLECRRSVAVAEGETFVCESRAMSRGDVGTSGRGIVPIWDEATAVGWYVGERG